MIVSQFIEWLKTQDQEATVEVLCVAPSFDYGGYKVVSKEFEPELSYYLDLRGNPHVKETDSYYNSRTLKLGEE